MNGLEHMLSLGGFSLINPATAPLRGETATGGAARTGGKFFSFRGLRLGILVTTLFLAAFAGHAQTTSFAFNEDKITLPATLPGMFAGRSGNWLVAGGGLDSAGNPVAEVFVGKLDNGTVAEWKKLALPYPVAFAAFAMNGAELLVAGGLTTNGATKAVTALKVEDAGQLAMRKLADLPAARVFAAAAVSDNRLFVVGGAVAADAAAAERSVFRLNLKPGLPADEGWVLTAEIPDAGRLLPSVIGVQRDIVIIGGFTVAGAGADKVFSPTASTLTWRWKEVDGTTYKGWVTNTLPSQPLAASVLRQTGQAHVFVAGGLTEPVTGNFISGLATARRSESAEVFHTITDTWVPKGKLPVGMALGMAVPTGADSFLILNAQANSPVATKVEIQSTVRNLAWVDWGIIVIYFIAMAWLGLYYSGKQETAAQYSLGNRDVPWWASGISMFATAASSISIIAIPAQAFQSNMVWFFPQLLLIPLFFLEAYIIYPLIRRLEITSTYEYLGRRFHPSLRYIASLQCIALQVFGRMNIVLLLPALVISAMCGFNIYLSVALMGILTTVYTALGGFKAVIWTDVIQGFLKFFAVLLIAVVAIWALPGGWGEFVKTSVQYHKFDYAIWSLDYTLPIFWIAMMTPLLTKLAFAADQPVVQRVFATPLKDVRKLAFIFLVCSVLISLMVNLAGISMFSFFKANPQKMEVTMANDQLLPLFVAQALPIGVVGLIIACLFAAAMATLSSSMNSVATIFVEDFYGNFKKTTDRERLIVLKITSALSGLIGTGCALYMASLNQPSLFQTWNELFALLGGGFLGIYILGIFTRRTNAVGAVVGAIASIFVTIYVKKFTTVHWYFYMPVAVFSCVGIAYVVSLIFPGPRKDLNGLTVFDMRHDLNEGDAPVVKK